MAPIAVSSKLFLVAVMVASTTALRSRALPLHPIHKNRRRPLPTSSSLSSSPSSPPSQSSADGFTVQDRALMAGLALAGSAETALLTASKISGTPVAAIGGLCTSPAACADVLGGPYAAVPFLDVPLSAVGFVMYTSVALLCVAPALGNAVLTGRGDDSNARALVLMLTSTMATFSAYLVALLALQLHTACGYCFASAGLSLSLAALAWTRRTVPRATEAAVLAGSSVAATALGSALLYVATGAAAGGGLGGLGVGVGVPAAMASTAPAAQVLAALDSAHPEAVVNAPPKVTTKSSPRALAVGRRLQASGAKMYGAYWCSHCYNQKQALGAEVVAAGMAPYVECDRDGFASQRDLCRDKRVPGFPTWEIQGKQYPGEKDLAELEAILDAAGVPK